MFFMGSGFTIIIRIGCPYDILFGKIASLGFSQVFFVLASNGLGVLVSILHFSVVLSLSLSN